MESSSFCGLFLESKQRASDLLEVFDFFFDDGAVYFQRFGKAVDTEVFLRVAIDEPAVDRCLVAFQKPAAFLAVCHKISFTTDGVKLSSLF
jgi:hypothetical protein